MAILLGALRHAFLNHDGPTSSIWMPRIRSQPFGYNPLRYVREDRIALAASGMMDVFKKMWPDAWGVRMEHILRNVLMALLEQRDATLHDVLRIFSDKEFRKSVARSLRNETVRTFLLKEFDQFSFGYRADGTAPIQNKVGAFLADPLLDRILTSPEVALQLAAGARRDVQFIHPNHIIAAFPEQTPAQSRPGWSHHTLQSWKLQRKINPNAFGERAVLKLMFGALIRAAERWRSIKVTEFERRQLAAVRKELDQEYEAQVGLKMQLSKDATPMKISSNPRT